MPLPPLPVPCTPGIHICVLNWGWQLTISVDCHIPYCPYLKGLLWLVHEEEMVHKSIFSCVWPCSSQIIANPKSLLNIHVHSFLWSVNFYWAPKMFQTLASALETQKWIRQIAHSLEGYVSKTFWWSEWHVNIPLNTSVKTDFSLSKCWGNRSLGEFILKYSSPISHIPISNTKDRLTSEALQGSEADITSWLHGFLVHGGSKRNGASRTFHPAISLVMYLKRPISRGL